MEKITLKFLDFDEERVVTLYGFTEPLNLVLGAVCKEYTPISIYRKSVETKEKES